MGVSHRFPPKPDLADALLLRAAISVQLFADGMAVVEKSFRVVELLEAFQGKSAGDVGD
jgi:hypothetical protein